MAPLGVGVCAPVQGRSPLVWGMAVVTGSAGATATSHCQEAMGRAPSRHRWALPALAAAVAVEVLALWYFSANAWFFFDDYYYFRQAEQSRLSLAYLFKAFPYNGHLSPFHRLADWILQRYFPLSWSFAQDLMLAFFAASVVMLYLTVARMVGPGPGPLVLSAVYATSIVHVDLLKWWSSGIHRLPSVTFSLACILAWMQYQRRGRRRWLAISLASLALGLASYEMAALVPVYLVLWDILVTEPDASLARSSRRVLGQWRVWLAYAVLDGAYGVVHLSAGGQPARWPGLGAVAGYVASSWSRAFVPSLAGLAPTATRPAWVLAILELAVAGLVAWSVLRRRRAWRPWAFLALVFVANTVVFSLGQLGRITVNDALALRYYPESTYLFCLAAAAAVLAPPGRRRPPQEEAKRSAPEPSGPGGRWSRYRVVPEGHFLSPLAVVAVVVAVTGHLGLSLATDGAGRPDSLGPSLHGYVARMAGGLERIKASVVGEPTLVSGGALATRPSPWMEASNRDLILLLDPNVRFNRPAPELYRLSEGLQFQRVAPTGSTAGGPVRELAQDGSLTVAGGRVRAVSGSLCVRAGSAPAEVGYQPRMDPAQGTWYLELGYRSAAAQTVTMTVGATLGGPALTRPVLVGGAEGSVLVALGRRPSVGRLTLAFQPGTDICLFSLSLGRLAPVRG